MPPLTPEAWAQIRHAYERTSRPVDDICLEHGTTPNTVRNRARRWGWKMRRPPIPIDGPPEIVPVLPPAPPSLPIEPAVCQPVLSPVHDGEAGCPHPNPPPQAGEAEERGRESEQAKTGSTPHDSASMEERLQGAVARVLPAIETTLARLAAGPVRGRDIEVAARALSALLRVQRELNALLGQHRPPPVEDDRPPNEDDRPPENIDAMRDELTRRIEALVASEREAIPARYEAAWLEMADRVPAEAGAFMPVAQAAEDEPLTPRAQPRLRRL